MKMEDKLQIARATINSMKDENAGLLAAIRAAQRTPLSKTQIVALNEEYGYFEYGDAQGNKTIDFVRAVEEKHGIFI